MKNSIKVERAKNDLTQAKLAELVGVSRQTINSMELGKYVPSTVLALRLSRVFRVSVNEIFELDHEDS
ncbi:MAG: helix-turn-helix transcriptional regulator [Marinoscillum sp.]